MHPTGVPATIAIPAPPGAGGGGVPGPDSPRVAALVDQAADLLKQALELEKDAEDKATIADMIARAHKFTGSQQKLADQALGTSPAVRAMRKSY
jgi:hypothetical protein